MKSKLFININNLVSENHPYRKFLSLLNFKILTKPLNELRKNEELGRKGYTMESGFKMLLLQYMEDLSDRELEKYLIESITAKFFCGFDLEDKTPDHSYFGHLRKLIGTERLSKLFNKVRKELKKQGLVQEVFTFVDASHLISKLSLWEERDKALSEGEKTFNNEVAKRNKKISSDPEARFGSKGKKKFWFGYKRHVSVDSQSGLINNIYGSSADMSDAEGLNYVCPDSGAILADKGYCSKKVEEVLKSKGCHSMIIKRNNMKEKNRDKDRWISALRSPYERVFSNLSRKAKYKGQDKIQFQMLMEALAFNLKRLTKLKLPDDLVLCAS